jgi:glycosyltransferase involved in cell wall biosynthesis
LETNCQSDFFFAGIRNLRDSITFSVLVANFNKGKFIEQAIKSVIKQSFKNWEVIVIDDCSTDNSWDFLQTLDHPQIQIYQNKIRQYCSSTYALALSIAKGELVGVLDSDDALAPQALERVAGLYRSHPDVGYLWTQHYLCNSKLEPLQPQSIGREGYSRLTNFFHFRTFRRCLSEKATLFPQGLRHAVDRNLGYELEALSVGGFINEPLYYYRTYKQQMSYTSGNDQLNEMNRLIEQHRIKRESLGNGVGGAFTPFAPILLA